MTTPNGVMLDCVVKFRKHKKHNCHKISLICHCLIDCPTENVYIANMWQKGLCEIKMTRSEATFVRKIKINKMTNELVNIFGWQ